MSCHLSDMDCNASMRPFKRCSLCGKTWETREAFLHDPLIRLEGYQWTKRRPTQDNSAGGLLIFSHVKKKCGTTLAVFAAEFRRDITNSSGMDLLDRELG